jgi:hypothetical protein
MSRKSLNSRVSAAAQPPDGRTKRAVIYLRVSTQRQADSGFGGEKGFSITEQQEVCEAKAAQLDAEIIEVYIDEAETARVADRPELMRMMARIKELKDVDYVIVHKLDRFSRDALTKPCCNWNFARAARSSSRPPRTSTATHPATAPCTASWRCSPTTTQPTSATRC